MDTQPQQPLIPPPVEEMIKVWPWILETLKNQGLSFLLLGVAVWYLNGQNDQLRIDLKTCQDDNKNELIPVLKENTTVLQKILYYVEKQEIRNR